MKAGRLKSYFLHFCLLVCLFAAPVSAGEGGSENAVGGLAGTIFKWINFGIVAFGLWYVFARLLPRVFRGRAEGIAASIADASKAKQEAERKLREAEAKLKRLDLEIGVLREAAERDAAAEAGRIRTAAREEALKIERAAGMEIQAAERAARMELKALAARLAVERAEAELRRKMTPAAQATIFHTFVEGIVRSVN